MKAQPVAQCQGPGEPIRLDLMSLDHLRLGRPTRVQPVERVEDEIGVMRLERGPAKCGSSTLRSSVGTKTSLCLSARPIRGDASPARLAAAALSKTLLRIIVSSRIGVAMVVRVPPRGR